MHLNSRQTPVLSQLPERWYGEPLSRTMQAQRISRGAYERVDAIVTREFGSLRSHRLWQYKNRAKVRSAIVDELSRFHESRSDENETGGLRATISAAPSR